MSDNNGSDNSLTADEISEFKALLQEKRNEILGDLITMEGETCPRRKNDFSNMSIRMDDAGSDNYEIENTLGLMDSEIRLVREIDAALHRIKNNTYGICEGNGKPIPKARLEAIPWAKYCVEYASMLEKGLVKKTFSLPEIRYDFANYEDDDEPGIAFRRIVG